MARGQVFNVPENIARGYKVPRDRPILPNGAGVTAIMGLTNGRGAAKRARRAERCRDEDGRFASCDESTPNRRRGRKASRRRTSPSRTKRGGATCWAKPRAKYVRLGAKSRKDYAYPECWAYPIHGRGPWSKRLTAQAIRWFRTYQHKYTPSVRAKIAQRIGRAARSLGLSAKGVVSGRSLRRARRNEGERAMIVLDPTPNRRGKRRGKKSYSKRGKRSHGMPRFVTLTPKGRGIRVARRNGEDDFEYVPVSDYGDDEFVRNRRRGRGKSKSRRRHGGRKSARRGYARRSHGKKGRWGKARKHSRKYGKRGGKGRSFKGVRRVQARRAGKGLSVFVKNSTTIPNLFGAATTDAQRQYMARARAARGGAFAGKSGTVARRMSAIGAERRRMAMMHRAAMRPTMGGAASFLLPWQRASYDARMRRRAERMARKQARMAMAMPAVMRGLSPRDLKIAMKDMTRAQVEKMFPDYYTFRTWMGAMRGDSKFRRWSGKARKYSGGRRRGRWGRAAARRRGRWGRSRRRRGSSRRRGRWSGKRRGSSRRRGRWGRARRRGHGRRRRGSARRGRWSRSRRFRRNGEFMPNMPYTSIGEMLVAGLCGLGTFGAIHYGSKAMARVHPLAGALTGLALGGLAAFASDYIPFIKNNDAYAKAASFAGIFGIAITGIKALLGAVNPMSGFGSYYQAQAGFGAPFQQAMAGGFQQAQAGFGEYYGANGLGEYVSNDGALQPVNDFGEYVAGHLNVEGYGDYEVSSQYSPGADGFGYMNDGVNPGANLDREFDVIEAAAGFGGAPAGRSDYVPTIQSGMVGSRESSEYSGVFDVGGPNGVFG